MSRQGHDEDCGTVGTDGSKTKNEIDGRHGPTALRLAQPAVYVREQRGAQQRMIGKAKGFGHIPELDGVRGIAGISIVLLHCLCGIWMPDTAFGGSFKIHANQFLVGAVDLFFVLSGLLIGGILLDNRESPNYFRAFWTRRAARILPALFVLVLSYTAALWMQRVWQFPQLSIWVLEPPLHSPLWYATFTQSIPLALYGWGPKWVGVTWSLAIEEQFYLLFPFAVYFLTRRSIVKMSIAAIIAAPLIFAVIYWIAGLDAGYVLLPSRMSSLFLGVLVACTIRNGQAMEVIRRYRFLLDAAILFLIYSIYNMLLVQAHSALNAAGYTFLAILFHVPLIYFELALLSALMLLRIFVHQGGLFRFVLRGRLLRAAGLISYALYLYHQAVNGTLHAFFFNHAPQISNLREFGVALLAVALACTLATVSYFVLERPIRNLGQRIVYQDLSTERRAHHSEVRADSRFPVIDSPV
jgi:peptidoglycan/LPS O-acetylase OafA/YrhL